MSASQIYLPEEYRCLDLGCGTGMLTCAAAFLCDVVFAVDCDIEALRVAQENARSVELDDTTNFILARVRIGSNSRVANKGASKRKGTGRGGGRGRGRGVRSPQRSTKEILIEGLSDGIPMKDNCVDTVISNPPFGTKMNEGIDAQFLRSATRLARKAVYSFHKTSTRPFLSKLVAEWGFKLEVVAEMKFDIPQSYKFHKQATKDVEVDLLRVVI
mmetsp:Transcript_42330/g.102291  ORF Transcript_42330/g.102291 Transcript_42330/m.102291 type:complete len:215 (+) Transcript_42330:1528-2172(+)